MKKTILSRLSKLEDFMCLSETGGIVAVPGDVYKEMCINAGETDWEPEGGWPQKSCVIVVEPMTKEEWMEKLESGGFGATKEEIEGWLKWHERGNPKRSP
jgi:hypothetical protein